MTMNKDNITDLFESRLLRREAGDEWHEAGINNILLGAIVLRETLLDEIISSKDEMPPKLDRLWEEYEQQIAVIAKLKAENNIGDPPVLPGTLDE